MVYIDASEVARLAADLQRAPGRMERDARRTMKRTALEVKRKMMKEFQGHSYGGKVYASLEFQKADADGLAYEIGELDSAGPSWGIAAILAYGTSNNAPVVDHTMALHREAPTMEKYLGDAAEEDVFGTGGRS